jgi:hypothetical protein
MGKIDKYVDNILPEEDECFNAGAFKENMQST